MKNDAILLQMSPEEFEVEINQALKACGDFQEGKRLPLTHSIWAKTAIVEDMLLCDEPQTNETRALTLNLLLRWSVEQIRPIGDENFGEPQWQNFAALYYTYFKGETFSSLAKRIHCSDIYDPRTRAIKEIAYALLEELRNPQHQKQRKDYAIAQRLQMRSSIEKHILGLLAVFDRALPQHTLQKIAQRSERDLRVAQSSLVTKDEEVKIDGDISNCISELLREGWLCNATEGGLSVHSELHSLLFTLASIDELRVWHICAAEYESNLGEYLVAANHWYDAGNAHEAVGMLSAPEHFTKIVNNGQIESLYKLQAKLLKEKIEPEYQAQLHISVGRAALMVGHKDAAKKAFDEALISTDVYTKAQAHYYQAKTFETRLFREASVNFDRGIALLDSSSEKEEQKFVDLLAKLYIGKAWLYIQINPDFEIATSCLEVARTLITLEQAENSTALQAAYAALDSAQKKHLDATLDALYKALPIARETGNDEAICKALFNLAQELNDAKRYDEGLDYLGQALELATKLRDTEKSAKCWQSMGAVCFYQEKYMEAVYYYLQAYKVYKVTQNDLYLCSVCYDLTEAYTKLQEWSQAKEYYKEAERAARRSGNENLRAELKKLSENYIDLNDELNSRQIIGLKEISLCGKISSGRYRELTGCSKSTAERDLDDLVSKRYTCRIGKGPGTYYERVDHTA